MVLFELDRCGLWDSCQFEWTVPVAKALKSCSPFLIVYVMHNCCYSWRSLVLFQETTDSSMTRYWPGSETRLKCIAWDFWQSSENLSEEEHPYLTVSSLKSIQNGHAIVFPLNFGENILITEEVKVLFLSIWGLGCYDSCNLNVLAHVWVALLTILHL